MIIIIIIIYHTSSPIIPHTSYSSSIPYSIPSSIPLSIPVFCFLFFVCVFVCIKRQRLCVLLVDLQHLHHPYYYYLPYLMLIIKNQLLFLSLFISLLSCFDCHCVVVPAVVVAVVVSAVVPFLIVWKNQHFLR